MHSEAVDQTLLQTLQMLMQWEEASEFMVAGGISLALRFGYRIAVHLNLITSSSVDYALLGQQLERRLPTARIAFLSQHTVCATYRGIKIAFVQDISQHPLTVELIEGIRYAPLSDIAAMKIHSVASRGSKNDFSDLLYLHENGLPLKDALHNFVHKYGSAMLFSAIRSLTNVGDTRMYWDPLYLNAWNWNYVETHMRRLSHDLVHTIGDVP